MKILYIYIYLFITACAIEEVPRQPLLSPPNGLSVQKAPALGSVIIPPADGLAIYFTANNNEIYFDGFLIYISTVEADFQEDTNVIIPTLKPTDKPGSSALLLKNLDNTSDTVYSIYKGGQMSFPELVIYPVTAPYTNTQKPVFTLTCFSDLPNGNSFQAGTTYYFAAYSYSSVDDTISLPSNIAKITF